MGSGAYAVFIDQQAPGGDFRLRKKDPRSGLRLVKFAITPDQFYLSPHVACALSPVRLHPALPPH
jgi:hypothetical protein